MRNICYNTTCSCGCSSSGRAPPCQGGGSEFEPRHPLHKNKSRCESICSYFYFTGEAGRMMCNSPGRSCLRPAGRAQHLYYRPRKNATTKESQISVCRSAVGADDHIGPSPISHLDGVKLAHFRIIAGKFVHRGRISPMGRCASIAPYGMCDKYQFAFWQSDPFLRKRGFLFLRDILYGHHLDFTKYSFLGHI